MKKLLALLLAVIMCLSLFTACDLGDDDDDRPRKNKKQPQEIIDAPALYRTFLLESGYELLTDGDYSEDENWTIRYILIDMNEDNVPELLVELADETYIGVAGYTTYGAFLAIQNGEVVTLNTQFYSGGTMGGTLLQLRYDEQRGKAALSTDGYYRDGAYSSLSQREIFEYNGEELVSYFSSEAYYYYIPANQTTVDTMKSITRNYRQDGDAFYIWSVGSDFVTENDYNAANSCYATIDLEWETGTMDEPINLG